MGAACCSEKSLRKADNGSGDGKAAPPLTFALLQPPKADAPVVTRRGRNVVLLLRPPGLNIQEQRITAELGIPLFTVEHADGTPCAAISSLTTQGADGRRHLLPLQPPKPAEDFVRLLAARLAQPDCHRGFILEGFPRTAVEDKLLRSTLVPTSKEVERLDGDDFNLVVQYQVPDHIVVSRAPPQEAEEVIARLDAYHQWAEPMLYIFGALVGRGGCVLATVDANRRPRELWRETEKAWGLKSSKKIVLLLAPLGVGGKGACGGGGTGGSPVSPQLLESMGLPRLSPEDLLREALVAPTEAADKLKEHLASTKLLTPDAICSVIRARLREPDCTDGAILDDFPRELEHARALDTMLLSEGERVSLVIDLQVPDHVLLGSGAGAWLQQQVGPGPGDSFGGQQPSAHQQAELVRRYYEHHLAPIARYYSRDGRVEFMKVYGNVADEVWG